MGSDRAPQLSGFGQSVARTLRGICFNGEDWLDCVLATARMSAAWRYQGKMPQFYVDNDGKCYLLPSLSPLFCFPLLGNSYLLLRKKKGFALFAIAGSEQFLSLEQVIQGVRGTYSITKSL